MLFVNETKAPVKIAFKRPQGVIVKPGETIDIEDGYALPLRADNGSRRPSIIENLAPQLKPADEAERAEWEKAPELVARAGKKQPASLPTVAGLIEAGVAPGVAKEMVRKILASAMEQLDSDGEVDAAIATGAAEAPQTAPSASKGATKPAKTSG